MTPETQSSVFRNGEYYFIPHPEFKLAKGQKPDKWKCIDRDRDGGHRVRDSIIVNGVTYIRGTVRHNTRRMVACRFKVDGANGKKVTVEPWYEVVRSNQVGSWKGRYYWG